MKTLFIADLHLQPKQAHIAQLFINYIRKIENVDALYILGDLFEAWIGDDDRSKFNRKIIATLSSLADKGITTYVMHGNRDFLLGNQFAQSAKVTLITDPTIINLYGTPTILLHGDTLCTDDIDYQQYRKKIRDPQLQASLLKKPLFIRRYLARKIRKRSLAHTANAKLTVMDVNQNAVKNIFADHKVTQMIHGHTHLPAIHYFQHNHHTLQRIVLSDWHHQGNVLSCYDDGTMRLEYFNYSTKIYAGTPL